jgi:hypothetical protein
MTIPGMCVRLRSSVMDGPSGAPQLNICQVHSYLFNGHVSNDAAFSYLHKLAQSIDLRRASQCKLFKHLCASGHDGFGDVDDGSSARGPVCR